MFCAPVVACEISDPPTTPRGTSWSAPGFTTFIAPGWDWRASIARPSLPPVSLRARRGRHLDLERTGLVVDLERRVVDVEALVEQLVQRAANLVAVVAGAYD